MRNNWFDKWFPRVMVVAFGAWLLLVLALVSVLVSAAFWVLVHR